MGSPLIHTSIVPMLSPEQKRHFLALEAENNLPYPQLPAEARRALDYGNHYRLCRYAYGSYPIDRYHY